VAKLVRLIIPATTATLSLIFTAIYVAVEKHNAVDHRDMELPGCTMLVTRLANWVTIVPVGLLIVGLWALRTKRDSVLDVVRDAMWAVGILWPVMSIALWKLPYILL